MTFTEKVLRRFEVWRTRCQLFIIITSALLLCPDTLCLDFSSVLSWPLTSDLCSSSMQQEKTKSYASLLLLVVVVFFPCVRQVQMFLCLFSSFDFCQTLPLVLFFFFGKAFPRLRLLHFSTLRCCSNVTVTFVTERLFTVGVCTRLWPLVFGVVPSYFCEFSFILFSHSPECLTKNKTKKKNFTCFYSVAFLPVV